ncbi:unnamed protein product, partial [marine sediment metagenome]
IPGRQVWEATRHHPDEYTRELSRILRDLLAAGSKRDIEKMLELAQDIEKLAMVARGGNPD